VGAALALSSCAIAPVPQYGVSRVAAGDERIVFPVAAFEGTSPVQVRLTDRWEHEDYALFQGGGAQAEILFAGVATTPIALNYGYTVARGAQTWSFNRGRVGRWGTVGKVRTRLADFFYRPYRIDAEDRDCMAFSAEWDDPADDPFHRPGRVLFGYYCAATGVRLPSERIPDLLRQIDLREPAQVVDASLPGRTAEPVAVTGAAPVDVARGTASGSETGNPHFPFYFAEHYQDFDGSDRTP